MHPTDQEVFTLGPEPYVVLRFLPSDDDSAPYDLKIQAAGIDSTDELATALLVVVEQITGVDTDLYVQQVDMMRQAARGAAPSASQDRTRIGEEFA